MATARASGVTVTKVMFNRIPAIARALTDESDKLVQKTATDLMGEMVTSLEGGRHGRQYGSHRASAPGEKPARLYGTLAGGIGIRRRMNAAEVFSAAAHTPHLEYGTRNMAPRPFMRPAARKFNAIFQFAARVMVERAAGAGNTR